MQDQPGTRVPLTDFRNDLTEILDRLDESGPVRVLRHGAPIAEIRSATPEGDRWYARRVLGAFGYLEELDAGLTGLLARLGIDTLEALIELASRHRALVDSGVTFDRYAQHALPESGPLTVDEALARLYFSDDYPEGVDEPYAWFLTCAKLQEEAVKRGLDSTLPQPNGYDESQPTFIELAISSGHTPQSLLQFGISSLDQRVPLIKLADLLGEAAVPADVAAMREYDDYWFMELTTGAGLSHGEAVAFFRAGLGNRVRDGITLVNAGVTTAEEIKELLDAEISLPLVTRARQAGLTPEQWRVQVPMIQHLKYEEEGNLSFGLLVEAAREKVSLVRWDKSSLPIKGENQRRSFHADSKARQGMYPWVHVFPGRVLDLARAGISPSYITAFSKLMEEHYRQPESMDDFADLAIKARGLGLTTALADAMSGSEAKRSKLTPALLVAVLEEGLTDVGTAHYLATMSDDPEGWLRYLRERRERQLMTDTFVATVEHTETWDAVRAAALALQGLVKSRLLRDDTPYLKQVVGKFLARETLNDHEVLTLLIKTAYAFGDHSYLPRDWREKYGKFAEPVRQLAKNFDEMRKAQTPAE